MSCLFQPENTILMRAALMVISSHVMGFDIKKPKPGTLNPTWSLLAPASGSIIRADHKPLKTGGDPQELQPETAHCSNRSMGSLNS